MINEIIAFTTGQMRATHRIIINQDDICENSPNENVFSNIVLNSGQPPINLIRRGAAIIIDDTNEPECHGRTKHTFCVYYRCNEGTKVQNPRRLCHVHCNIHVYYTWQYAYADKCVSVRGSIRKFGKDKSSSSLLPTLRGISGTA